MSTSTAPKTSMGGMARTPFATHYFKVKERFVPEEACGEGDLRNAASKDDRFSFRLIQNRGGRWLFKAPPKANNQQEKSVAGDQPNSGDRRRIYDMRCPLALRLQHFKDVEEGRLRNESVHSNTMAVVGAHVSQPLHSPRVIYICRD
ncbi:hypothetical protein QR680_000450 [Steinernema hermaphroditum]|uniref:Uncharacterized protein n=1 Tax=Steinernema hermaphroditum TaxID=289476 RepID=A0AA39GXF1_9BILA|nr:hypothetical protein QR680_000450 [Steinernema hermaphroditum]